jgi:hypothetical protein
MILVFVFFFFLFFSFSLLDSLRAHALFGNVYLLLRKEDLLNLWKIWIMDATELSELHAIEKYNKKNITFWHFHIIFFSSQENCWTC